MEYYNPKETMSFDQSHTVRLRFQFQESFAEVITTMAGNVMGGDILSSFTDLDTGITAPSDNPTNQKHCLFDEEDENNYKEVTDLTFRHATDPNETYQFELEDAAKYLVSIEIINYRP
jgi:hypothetical protein